MQTPESTPQSEAARQRKRQGKDGAAEPVTSASTQPPTYLEVVEFELRWPLHCDAKVSAVRDQFDIGIARYYQLLDAGLDDAHVQSALGRDVELLRTRRARRRRQRTAPGGPNCAAAFGHALE